MELLILVDVLDRIEFADGATGLLSDTLFSMRWLLVLLKSLCRGSLSTRVATTPVVELSRLNFVFCGSASK